MADLVPMQLARIVKNDLTDKHLIYLKQIDGDRQFPIFIGFFEATNIDLRVTHAERPPRPLTHDLIVGVAEALGAKVEAVVIKDFQDDIFYAVLRLMRNGQAIDVDSRPSDAIAIAVSHRPILPIFVSREVFDRFAQ
jgi:bifunctional DNase/RNase